MTKTSAKRQLSGYNESCAFLRLRKGKHMTKTSAKRQLSGYNESCAFLRLRKGKMMIRFRRKKEEEFRCLVYLRIMFLDRK